MQPLPNALTLCVLALGLGTLAASRLPAFQKDFRRSIALCVAAVSLLTTLLSLNVLIAAMNLGQAAAQEQVASVNALFLAGLVMLLVSALAFFFSVGVMLWTSAPLKPATTRPFPDIDLGDSGAIPTPAERP